MTPEHLAQALTDADITIVSTDPGTQRLPVHVKALAAEVKRVQGVLTEVCTERNALLAEVERLRERVAELEPFEPQLKEMNLGPKGWSMTITEAKNASVGFIAAAKGMLDGTGADNYVEQEIILNGEQYVIIYCRPGGKTPHQLKQDAEAEVERLKADAAKATRWEARLAETLHYAQLNEGGLSVEVERLTTARDGLLKAADRADTNGVHVMSTSLIRDHLTTTDGGETT